MISTRQPSARQQKSWEIRRAILTHWRSKSDRQIAELVHASNKTVSNHRAKLEQEGLILPRFKSTQADEACLHHLCTSAIEPASLNDVLYERIDESEPAFLALVDDIRQNGVLEPLVVSRDGYILSGHRRHAAAEHLDLDRIPVRIHRDASYEDDPDGFMRLLASFNRQRVKTTQEQVREELALASHDSQTRVRRYRDGASQVLCDGKVVLRRRKKRSGIRDKVKLRDAIIRVVMEQRHNWPLSDRAVHYRLLNIPGLVRNDKTRIPYGNNKKSYNDVTNMLTRLRFAGDVPFEAIADETRSVVIWDAHRSVGDFVRQELDGLLSGYYRNLLQSQPNWIELLVEKNTVASQLRSVAAKYTLPMTSGRGYSSVPPRKAIADRFQASGREKLVVIVVSDFDPEGEDIPVSFGVSLRDDFQIQARKLEIIKASLTANQVRTLGLHEGQLSKATSSRYKRFVAQHGERVWELEALDSDFLRDIVEDAIRDVLDLEAFEQELDRELNEQEELKQQRQRLGKLLREDFDRGA